MGVAQRTPKPVPQTIPAALPMTPLKSNVTEAGAIRACLGRIPRGRRQKVAQQSRPKARARIVFNPAETRPLKDVAVSLVHLLAALAQSRRGCCWRGLVLSCVVGGRYAAD